MKGKKKKHKNEWKLKKFNKTVWNHEYNYKTPKKKKKKLKKQNNKTPKLLK